jgi:HK97 gp10 family phage protein
VAYTSRIPQITIELAAKVDAALKAGAEAVERDAKARAPVNTGKLRAAIHTDRQGPGEYAVVAGDDDVFYGHLVEFGTTYTPAHPFMIPAAEAKRQAVAASVAAALKGL